MVDINLLNSLNQQLNDSQTDPKKLKFCKIGIEILNSYFGIKKEKNDNSLILSEMKNNTKLLFEKAKELENKIKNEYLIDKVKSTFETGNEQFKEEKEVETFWFFWMSLVCFFVCYFVIKVF